MEKHRTFQGVKFDSKTFYAVNEELKSLASSKITYHKLGVKTGTEEWRYNTVEEFLAAVDTGWAQFQAAAEKELSVLALGINETVPVVVAAPTRDKVERIFAAFENNVERCRLPEPPPEATPKPRVFIGHGADPQWRDLKDHLHEKHGFDVEAYEIGSRAGHAIRDILESMLKESTLALLVMTGEDETKDGKLVARQNVVHEAGLFQGHLGFSRAIILLEEGTEEFSNIAGLQQIRFSKGNIKETFGDVLAVLKRELG